MPGELKYDSLYKAIKLHTHRDTVSLVGGGGKTSIINKLAEELHLAGKRIIITTTTHTEDSRYPLIRMSGNLVKELSVSIEKSISETPVMIARRKVKGGKLKGITPGQAAMLNRDISFDYMLIEADGSAGKSLKAHHRYEPAVPPCTTFLIAVIGYDVIGKKLNISNVHRPQIFSRLTGKKMDDVICHEDIISILRHPSGLLKGRPPATRTTVFLTKVSECQTDGAKALASDILHSVKGINSVLAGDLESAEQLKLFS